MRNFRSCLIALPLLVACRGGDDTDTPDAAPTPDAAFADCDFDEVDDPGNDMAAEDTGLTVTAAAGVSLCGQVRSVVPQEMLVDADMFQLTLGNPGTYRIRIEAPDGALVEALAVDVYTHDGTVSLGLWAGGQALSLVDLPAGELGLRVLAVSGARPERTFAYRLTVAPDEPDERCLPLAGLADYTESADGPSDHGNDVLELTSDHQALFTTDPLDAPEPTELTLLAGTPRKLTGISADVPTSGGGALYRDHDTYRITTGPQTHELDLHLAWTGGDANLDLVLVAEAPGSWLASLAGAGWSTGPERAQTAVAPSTDYLVWVGAYDQVGMVLPVAYDLTICAAE